MTDVCLRPDRDPGRPPHEIADEHRDLAEAALDVLLDSSLEPIVDMVLTRRDGAYEALSADGRVRFTSDSGLVSVLEEEGANPIANQATDAFSPLDAELAHKHPHRRDNTVSERVRADRPALRRSRRARPVRAALLAAQLGGPGRPHRRARLDRRGAGPRAVGHRGPRRRQPRRRAARGAPRRRRAHDRVAARLLAVSARHSPTAASSAARTVSCATTCSSARNGRVTSSGSSSTAPTPTCSTRWPPRARRRTSRASSRWAPRSGTARWPACRRSRSPTTRRSSPARTRATTASSTTRGTTAVAQQVITNSPATWHTAMNHIRPGHRFDPLCGPAHVARRVHRVGQRALRRRRPVLHVRLLPAGRTRGSLRRPRASPT